MDQQDHFWSTLSSMVSLFTTSDSLRFSVTQIALQADEDCRSKNRIYYAISSLCKEGYVRCTNDSMLEDDVDDFDYDDEIFCLTEEGLETGEGEILGFRWVKDYSFQQEDKEIKLLGIMYTAAKSSIFGLCDLKVLDMDQEFPKVFGSLVEEGYLIKARFGNGTYPTESGLAALDRAMKLRGFSSRDIVLTRLKELKF